jgi:hypothetical protein
MRLAKAILASAVLGVLCLSINQLLLAPARLVAPGGDEYYWTRLATQNYSWLSGALMVASAALVAHKIGGNPVLIGFGTVAVFPLVSLAEAVVYRGSHNLLPFEIGIYILYSIPPIVGAWIGCMTKRRCRQTVKGVSPKY